MMIAAKFHEESRDKVRSGGLDEKSEEVFVSDTVWYRVETAVQRELCDQTPGSRLVTSLVRFSRDRRPERALRPDPWIAAGRISSQF